MFLVFFTQKKNWILTKRVEKIGQNWRKKPGKQTRITVITWMTRFERRSILFPRVDMTPVDTTPNTEVLIKVRLQWTRGEEMTRETNTLPRNFESETILFSLLFHQFVLFLPSLYSPEAVGYFLFLPQNFHRLYFSSQPRLAVYLLICPNLIELDYKTLLVL